MKTSHIDFAPRSLRRAIAHTQPTTLLAGAIGMMLCVSAAVVAYSMLTRSVTREAEQQSLHARLAARTPPAPRTLSITDVEANAVNAVVGRLNLPWRDVFHAVESATPESIALLELTPDVKQHAIKGVAEAKSSDEMLDYVTRLGGQPFFKSVVLTRHEINDKDPNKPLRFQFVAEWERAGK
jgi:Fimbrial assembly protein (PilN)